MATESHIGAVEEALAYTFHSKSLVRLALTAAGAEEEHHDGNKHLAAVGQATMRLSVADMALDKCASPGESDPGDDIPVFFIELRRPDMQKSRKVFRVPSTARPSSLQLRLVPVSNDASSSVGHQGRHRHT